MKLGDSCSRRMEALIKAWLTSRYPAACPTAARSATGSTKEIARKLDRH